MKKFSKLILMVLVLVIATSFTLISCVDNNNVLDPDKPIITPDPDPEPEPEPEPEVPVTDSEKYAKILSKHVSMKGYTLNIDSKTTGQAVPQDLYSHKDVTVASGIATATTTVLMLPALGQKPTPITTTKVSENYLGEKLKANLSLVNFAEGYTLTNVNGVITVTGTVSDIVAMFGSNASSYSLMTITIVANVVKNQISSYKATFTQPSMTSVMEYKVK